MNDSRKRPKLILFDLDYTLWPFWVHQLNSPFHKDSSGIVVDSRKIEVPSYEEVPLILKTLKQKGYVLAIVSKSSARNKAEQLIQLYDWNKFFSYKEIYPGIKTTHISKIQSLSGIAYKDMLFFDDEIRNIYEARTQGIVSIFVKYGLNKNVVISGLQDYSRERKYK